MLTKPLVLIIDDENEIIEILTFLLNRNGMDVVAATDGIEALKLLNSQKFAGVVSDLLMPNMDGLQLLKIVRGNANTTPFIFLSGHANALDEHSMINYGVYELIHKPELDKIPDALQKLFKSDKEAENLPIDFLDILHDCKKIA